LAAEVAACCGDGIGACAGVEVVERFLLDGIQMLTDQLSVGKVVEHSTLIQTNLADPEPALPD
jgi:hypothetical protein